MARRHKNHHLSGKISYTGLNTTPTDLQLIGYNNKQVFEKKITDTSLINSFIKEDCTHWISVKGMNNSEEIVSIVISIGLTTIEAKDILNVQRSAKIEESNGNILIMLPAIYYNEKNDLIFENLTLILGKNYLISFQESNYPLFDNIYSAIKENSVKIRTGEADFLLATILNEVLNNYNDTIAQVEEEMEDLEDNLLDIKNNKDEDLINDIQEKRRIIIRMRKLMYPVKDQFGKLIRADNTLIQRKQIPYFKELSDQVIYILQTLDSCREIMSSLVDLYLNNNDVKMNMVMKQLTVVATIFIPLTFIVGVWGMNFVYMPELTWEYGYIYAWGTMILIALLIWFYFKKKKWF